VEKSGDLSARVPLQGRDEVGQMASAFNAMQAGYQRIVGTVAALLDVQHHVLEGMQVGEDEADQQLRGRQQRQHQHQHG
ncbi:HAMP domain-containing protein, partial [Pseudomonas aeruginosa]|uniref:HAMP domain-containing protein n=1 Tax=Pseudomonas aeruginosa TaxID=287 RepID=UPI003F81A2A6